MTSRSYESEYDLWQMQDLLMQARLQTDDWRYAHVGDLLFQFFMAACHLNPREHIRLWHVVGKLVGYAVLGEDPAIDWQILPEYEWRGLDPLCLCRPRGCFMGGVMTMKHGSIWLGWALVMKR